MLCGPQIGPETDCTISSRRCSVLLSFDWRCYSRRRFVPHSERMMIFTLVQFTRTLKLRRTECTALAHGPVIFARYMAMAAAPLRSLYQQRAAFRMGKDGRS